MSKIQKRLRIFIETIIFIFLIGSVAFIIAASSIDLEKYRPEIIATLDSSLDGEVKLGTIEFSLFPYFGVRGRDFSFAGNETTPSVSADEVVIGLYLHPLVSGKVVPKKLRVISPSVFLTIEKDELLLDTIANIINRAAPKEGGEMALRELVIHDAALKITDERFGRTKKYTVTVSYAWFKGDLKKGPLRYSLWLVPPGGRGTIKSKGESGSDGGLDASVSLDRVGLDPANLVFTDYGDLSITGTVSGTVILTYHRADNLAIDGRIVGTDLRLEGSSAYPDGLRIDEIDVSGDLSVTPEGIDIPNLTISRDSLDVEAAVSFKKVMHRGGLSDDLKVQADVDGFDLKRDLALIPFGLAKKGTKEYAETLLQKGKFNARLDIEGKPAWIGTKAARLDVTGRLEGGALDLGGIVVSGVSADLTLSSDEITVDNVAFSDPSGTVRVLRWRIEHLFRAPYLRDFVVVVDDMAFEDVRKILASKVIAALPFLEPTRGVGRVKGEMKVEAPMGSTPGVPEVTGRVEFSDWALSVPFFTRAPMPGNAELIFEKDRMKIPPVTMRFAESTLTGEGELTNFARPRLVMSIAAPALDLVELFGTGDTTLLMTDLRSRLIFEEGYIILPDLKGKLYGGNCWGEFGYVYPETEAESLFYLNLTGQGTDLGALLTKAGVSDNVTGTAEFELSLKSDPGSPDAILKTIDGTAALTVKDGTIRKLSILSKIMSIMNISNYLRLKLPRLDTQGIPFDSITGDFAMQDGVLKTENLYFDSRTMKMSAVGTYDMVDDKLNTVMGFQLLQTIDLIVNKIPVVGYILTGDDGNLFTTYFRASGSLGNPTVEAMTLQGLGEGTINIFTRIFRFPLKGFIPR
jgi:hypothetical protein